MNNWKLKKSLVVPKEKENITHYNKSLKNLNQFKKKKKKKIKQSHVSIKKKLKIIEQCCKDPKKKGPSPLRIVIPCPSNQAQTIEFLREWVFNSSAM